MKRDRWVKLENCHGWLKPSLGKEHLRQAAIWLYLFTGVEVELLSAKWDVDLDRKELRLTQ